MANPVINVTWNAHTMTVSVTSADCNPVKLVVVMYSATTTRFATVPGSEDFTAEPMDYGSKVYIYAYCGDTLIWSTTQTVPN